MDIDSIRAHIKSEGRYLNQDILSIERMKKRTKEGWIDSSSIKISFNNLNMPNSVTLFHSFFRVRPFVYEPLHCYKCQRFGHRADSCKGKTRCLLCGQEHKNKDCNYKCEEDFKCANCGGQHKANSNKCTHYSNAKKIEEVRAKEQKTYSQARTMVMTPQAKINFPNLNRQVVHADVHQPLRSSYQPSHILKNSTWGGRKRTQITYETKEVSTQTVENSPINQDFLEKLKNCFCELFDSSILKESKIVRKLIVENALKKSFSQFEVTRDENNNKRGRALQDENDIDFFDAIDSEEEEDEEGVLSQDGMEDNSQLSQGTRRRSQRLKRNSQKKKKIEQQEQDSLFSNQTS